MRRVAVLADVHGNLPALEAVLDELADERVDAVVSAGDVVSGPFPAESLAALRALEVPVLWVRGNADRGCLEADTADVHPDDAWAAARLDDDALAFLATLAPSVVVAVDGLGPVRVCHGSPRSDEEILTTLSPDARVREALGGVAEIIVVGGHVHRQQDRRAVGRRLVNAGSVGMPYEGRPGAYWALLGPDVALRRTVYDVPDAAARIRATGFPGAEELLRDCLLAPVDPDEVSRAYEARAART